MSAWGVFWLRHPPSPFWCDILSANRRSARACRQAPPRGSVDPWPQATNLRGSRSPLRRLLRSRSSWPSRSYFLYTGYSRAEAVAESEKDKASKAQRAASDALSRYDEFRKVVGAQSRRIRSGQGQVDAVLQRRTSSGEQPGRRHHHRHPESPAIRRRGRISTTPGARTIVNSYQSEPNKNFMSTLDRLTELLENLTLLSTDMSANYVG